MRSTISAPTKAPAVVAISSCIPRRTFANLSATYADAAAEDVAITLDCASSDGGLERTVQQNYQPRDKDYPAAEAKKRAEKPGAKRHWEHKQE